jgi:hypothetical protein
MGRLPASERLRSLSLGPGPFARLWANGRAQLASIAFSVHKARTAARYRRPTRTFEDAATKFGINHILTLEGVIVSRASTKSSMRRLEWFGT